MSADYVGLVCHKGFHDQCRFGLCECKCHVPDAPTPDPDAGLYLSVDDLPKWMQEAIDDKR